MVWTVPPQGIPSNAATGAPFLANGDMGISVGGGVANPRFYFAKSDFWKLKNHQESGVGPQCLGGFDVLMPQLQGGTYSAVVSFHEPLLEMNLAKGALGISLRAWIADDENLFVMELTGGNMPVNITLKPWISGGNGSKDATGQVSGAYWISRDFMAGSGVDMASGATLATRKFGADSDTFSLQPAQKVVVVGVMKSLFETAYHKDAAVQRALALKQEDLAASFRKHQEWWHDYWSLSSVDIGDSVIERLYYGGLYALGSASRNPEFPPGIFGLWGTTNYPQWQGDYHTNYNFQAPYYGLYSSNRIRTTDPYDAPILAFVPRGKYYAQSILKIRGVLYPVGIGPKGIEVSRGSTYCNLGLEGNFAGQKSDAVFCAVNMAQRFYTTYDRTYVQKVYPFFREIADFWEDYLKYENGRYVIYHDGIHECTDDKNPLVSLGLVRLLFKSITDMSMELSVDADRRARWGDILSKLSAFPTQVKNGKTVFRYSEQGTDWWPDNTLGIQHIYPAGAIGLGSDVNLLAVARNTFEAMGRWKDFNGMNSYFPAAARIGYSPDSILSNLRSLATRMAPNQVPNGQPHGMENYSLAHNTINEMLLQSHEGLIRLFPVWPKSKDAGFANLRAYGAFLISSSMAGGEIREISLKSEKGRMAPILNPWKGSGVDLYRNGRLDATVRADTLKIATAAGEDVKLVKAGTIAARDVAKGNPSTSLGVSMHFDEIIVTGEFGGPLSISVFDIRNRLIRKVDLQSGQPARISLKNRPRGIYLLEAVGGGDKISKSIVLK